MKMRRKRELLFEYMSMVLSYLMLPNVQVTSRLRCIFIVL